VEIEHKDMVLDAWHAEEAIRIEKETTKKENEVYNRWKKFLIGLRIRKRVDRMYGEKGDKKEI
jgi:xeroderma pigmentosum group C-complementing protein